MKTHKAPTTQTAMIRFEDFQHPTCSAKEHGVSGVFAHGSVCSTFHHCPNDIIDMITEVPGSSHLHADTSCRSYTRTLSTQGNYGKPRCWIFPRHKLLRWHCIICSGLQSFHQRSSKVVEWQYRCINHAQICLAAWFLEHM